MKTTDMLEPIRRKIGQNEYFDLLSAIERQQQMSDEALKRADAQIAQVACDMDALRERFKYNNREKDAAESFLADMTKQRDVLKFENTNLKSEVKRLTEELEDEKHKAALVKKYGVAKEA